MGEMFSPDPNPRELGGQPDMRRRSDGGMGFLDFADMFDGGGAGRSGDEFEGGGILSMLANALFDPLGQGAPSASKRPLAARRPQKTPVQETPPMLEGIAVDVHDVPGVATAIDIMDVPSMLDMTDVTELPETRTPAMATMDIHNPDLDRRAGVFMDQRALEDQLAYLQALLPASNRSRARDIRAEIADIKRQLGQP